MENKLSKWQNFIFIQEYCQVDIKGKWKIMFFLTFSIIEDLVFEFQNLRHCWKEAQARFLGIRASFKALFCEEKYQASKIFDSMGAFFLLPTIYSQILYGFLLDVIYRKRSLPRRKKNFILGISQIGGGPCQNCF